MQLSFIGEVEKVQGRIEDSATAGGLDLRLGHQLLTMDEISFTPHQFHCSPGSVPRADLCGESKGI